MGPDASQSPQIGETRVSFLPRPARDMDFNLLQRFHHPVCPPRPKCRLCPITSKPPPSLPDPRQGSKQKRPGKCPTSFRDACRIQTCDLLIRSQMLYSAELRRHCLTGGPVCYSAAAAVSSFATVRLASLMRAFLPARLRR